MTGESMIHLQVYELGSEGQQCTFLLSLGKVGFKKLLCEPLCQDLKYSAKPYVRTWGNKTSKFHVFIEFIIYSREENVRHDMSIIYDGQ